MRPRAIRKDFGPKSCHMAARLFVTSKRFDTIAEMFLERVLGYEAHGLRRTVRIHTADLQYIWAFLMQLNQKSAQQRVVNLGFEVHDVHVARYISSISQRRRVEDSIRAEGMPWADVNLARVYCRVATRDIAFGAGGVLKRCASSGGSGPDRASIG